MEKDRPRFVLFSRSKAFEETIVKRLKTIKIKKRERVLRAKMTRRTVKNIIMKYLR